MSTQNSRAGRNEPCPCGSGKKYKKCHGGMTHANVVAEVAKIGPQWVERHLSALLQSATEEAPALAQCEIFDHEERLSSAESQTKDKRERDMLDSLKLSLSQSALEPFEVTEVRRGYGVSLKGSLSGRRYYVDSPEIADTFEPMEWLLGRVVFFGQKSYLLDDWKRVPFRRRKQLQQALISAYEPEEKTSSSESTDLTDQVAEATENQALLVPTQWLKERGAWILSTYQEVTSV